MIELKVGLVTYSSTDYHLPLLISNDLIELSVLEDLVHPSFDIHRTVN